MPLPHDPGPHWGEVGIHGLHRPRDWDEVAIVVAAEGAPSEVGFVALVNGTLVSDADDDLVTILAGGVTLNPPYRAEAVRRPDGNWAIGVKRITVVELEPSLRGNEIDLVWDGTARSVRIDGSPTFAGVPALERLGAARRSAYAIHATRLVDTLWEVELATL